MPYLHSHLYYDDKASAAFLFFTSSSIYQKILLNKFIDLSINIFNIKEKDLMLRYNLSMAKIVNEIKNLVNDRDITLKELAKKIGEAQNKNYSLASLSQKLCNETISYKEVKLIAEILGYKIRFIDLQRLAL